MVFRNNPLVKMQRMMGEVRNLRRFGHIDLWLSRKFGTRQIHQAKRSMFGVRKHLSHCAKKKGIGRSRLKP